MSSAAGAGAGSAAVLAPSDVAARAHVGSVFIKLAGTPDSFDKVGIIDGDDVSDLAKRASTELDWRVKASKVHLFLVPGKLVRPVQIDPSKHEATVLVVANRRLATDTLATAGIVDGSCLLARVVEASAAAPGECASTVRWPFTFSALGSGWGCGNVHGVTRTSCARSPAHVAHVTPDPTPFICSC